MNTSNNETQKGNQMTTYIRLEAIKRALHNHGAILVWVNGTINKQEGK